MVTPFFDEAAFSSSHSVPDLILERRGRKHQASRIDVETAFALCGLESNVSIGKVA